MAEEKDAVVAMFQPEDLRTDKWESFSISGGQGGDQVRSVGDDRPGWRWGP